MDDHKNSEQDNETEGRLIPDAKLSALAVAVWRIQRRVQRAEATPDAVRLACDGVVDHLHNLGIRWEEMIGEDYNENMRVRVVETHGTHRLRISECLSPGVYINDQLIQPAEVVVMGEETKG